MLGKGNLLAVAGWEVQAYSCTESSLILEDQLVRRWTHTEGYGDSASPPLEFFDAASLATEPYNRAVSLDVLENNQFTNEYALGASGCHRTF